MKLKLHLAPSFVPFSQDCIDFLSNTVPFCRPGIEQWCELVPLEQAQFVHLGQINCLHPYPFPVTAGNVIADLEGDEIPGTFREEFAGAIVTASCCPPHWSGRKVFPRPTMSRFLVHAARNLSQSFAPAKEHRLGFTGKRDTHGVRARVAEACVGLPSKIALLDAWLGPAALDHPARRVFEADMLNCSVALCPQGQGIATARLYEACFYGRCPVIIGQQLLLGCDWHETSFCIQIDAGLEPGALRGELERVAGMSIAEAQDRGRLAREYFDAVVRPYFADPTLCFLNWLNR